VLEVIRNLTPKPITTIINTHTHGDHVSGNVEFPATVEVIVHENTAANMQEMRASTQTAPSGQPPNIFKANNGRGMPTKTFKDRMTIGTGADRIDLYYFGRGHTNGDAWVVFPALRAMHAGDIFSGKNIPGLDAVNGGSGLAIADSLTKAADTIKNIDTIITGHSRTMTVADLREYAQFNRDFANGVRTAKAAGQSADEVAKAWKIPAKYAGYATPIPVRLLQNVQVVFDELK
jgi:cyclase